MRLDKWIIANGPYGRTWWKDGEELGEGYAYHRDARPDEIALAKRILASKHPPVSLGNKMRELIARD